MDYLSKKVLHGDLARLVTFSWRTMASSKWPILDWLVISLTHLQRLQLQEIRIGSSIDFFYCLKFFQINRWFYNFFIKGLLPVKWMAIESLRDWVFSSKLDVWSFGVVLCEIFSLAKVPYARLIVDDEFIRRFENGYRTEQPEFAPDGFGRLMTDCWEPEPHQRLTFSQLTSSLGVFMESSVFANNLQMEKDYLRMDNSGKLSSGPLPLKTSTEKCESTYFRATT